MVNEVFMSSYVKKPKQVSAGFIVVGKDNRLLIGKTSAKKSKYNWTYFKGKVEEGENEFEAAVRELKEESGIDIAASEYFQMSVSTNPFFTYSMKHKNVVLYLLRDSVGMLSRFSPICTTYTKAGNKEIAEFKWVSVDELYEHLLPSQRGSIEVLKKALDNKSDL